MTARRTVEAPPTVAGPSRVPPPEWEPLGMPQLAERLGAEVDTVRKWRWRGQLPEPRWTVGHAPAWAWADIVEHRHRLPGRWAQVVEALATR